MNIVLKWAQQIIEIQEFFMVFRMLKLAKPWYGSLVITVIALVGASVLSLVTPEAVRRLTALLGEPENLTTGILLTYAGIMTGAYLLRGVCFSRCGSPTSVRGISSGISRRCALTNSKRCP